MSDYNGGPRPLSWDLSRALVSSAITEDDGECEPSSFVWPEDSNERVLVPFFLSLNEYNVLASAIDVGSDIAYGEDAIRVNDLWLRNMRCDVNLCNAIAQAILTCTDVKAALATVIATDAGVQDSIRDFVISDPEINDHIADAARVGVLTLEEQVQNLLKPDECNYDFIFNQTTVLVEDLLNSLSEDLLQALIVGTNPLERGQILLSAIPAIGAIIPFDEILAFANELVEDVQEEYQNKYDEALEDELRCGLFCAFRDDCELSISDAMLFYSTKASETLPAEPLEALQATIQLFLAGVLPGDWVVYMMHLLILACIQAGQDVIGIDFAQMGIRIVAAGDEPNNDWMTLCTECPPEPVSCEGASVSYDFKLSNGGFVESVAGYGTWHSGSGWGVGSSGFTITVEKAITTPVNKARMYFSQTADGAAFLRNTLANGFGTYTGPSSSGVDDIGYWYEWDGLGGATAGICFQANPADSTQRLILGCLWYA